MSGFAVLRLLEALWVAAGLATGVIVGYLIAGSDPAMHGRRRRALWLAPGTLVAVLLSVGVYHGALASGWYVPRAAMAALGLDVLCGVAAVVAATAAAAKLGGWLPRAAVGYPGRTFVNASLVAFALGMLAYLIAYPLTPWVFHTLIVLAAVFGVVFAVPAEGAALPGTITWLNVIAGAAAGLAGFAMDDLILMVVGAAVAAAGLVLVSQ
jgi:proton-translocating NAD(P)+ transhydrogenase subunit beta